MPAPWEVLNESVHAECKVYSILRQRCRHTVNGKEDDFYVMEGPDWVQVLALTPENKLVMVNQYRFALGDCSWEVPGGCIHAGETPIEGALRELREETGYVGESAKIIGSCTPNPAIQKNRSYFVLIQNCKPTADTAWDEHEEIQIDTWSLEAVNQAVVSGKVHHALMLNALLFLNHFLNPKHS